jgi:hypothetical protein
MALSIRCLQGILANTQQLIYAPTATPLLGAHFTSARTTEAAKTMSHRPTQTQVASALQIGPAHTAR